MENNKGPIGEPAGFFGATTCFFDENGKFIRQERVVTPPSLGQNYDSPGFDYSIVTNAGCPAIFRCVDCPISKEGSPLIQRIGATVAKFLRKK